MRREDDGRPSPRWRAVLEARWRARLEEVTELSVAYHAAAADVLTGVEDPRARLLLHRAIAARQRLADTEDALGKVATGNFGHCEECGAFIAEVLLAAAPESRYCAGCVAEATVAAGEAEAATTRLARTGCVKTGRAAGRR
jgi:RNA polymerase-binding transcription factor DksA